MISALFLVAWVACGAAACVQGSRMSASMETYVLMLGLGPLLLAPLLVLNKIEHGQAWLPSGWEPWQQLRSADEDPLMLEAREEVERFMKEDL